MSEITQVRSARMGIDVGGTFTDTVLHDERGISVAKVLSTHPDPTDGVLEGLRALLARTGTELSEVTHLAHASTVTSNLVLERKGRRTALLTTAGFRDVLHLQRQKRADLYDLLYDKPRPLVDRRDIYEIPERIVGNGEVVEPLDEEAVRAAIAAVLAKQIAAIAVVLLHSYANAAHEQRIREIAHEVAPELMVSLSSDVSPKMREYERASTTAMNAYVMPSAASYLERMEGELRGDGLAGPLYVMQCSGGLAVAEAMKRRPVELLESGPAAGALAAGFVGRVCGRDRVISFDMGGTTAKVAIVEEGTPRIVEEFEIAHQSKLKPGSGLPVTVPAVDLIEIGTGGGSIAHVDAGILAVGPQSAGSTPGPCCYGRGGTEPTVTDANLVLGYLDPGYFLGGELTLDVDAARSAIERVVAQPLGIGVEEAAFAIHSLASASMANAMRAMTIQRGIDPRRYTVVAFGGAGPLQIASIAAEVGVGSVIVPANAGVASAFGLIVARVKFEFTRSLIAPLEPGSLAEMNEVLADLESRARAELEESGELEGSTLLRHVRMRYPGQGYEITVPVPDGALAEADLDTVRASFRDAYRRIYGYTADRDDLLAVDWRLTALGADRELPPAPRAATGGPVEPATRPAWFPSLGGYVETAVWNRYDVPTGTEIRGPAIVQERESTTVIPPGASARVDELRNVIVTLEHEEAGNGR